MSWQGDGAFCNITKLQLYTRKPVWDILIVVFPTTPGSLHTDLSYSSGIPEEFRVAMIPGRHVLRPGAECHEGARQEADGNRFFQDAEALQRLRPEPPGRAPEPGAAEGPFLSLPPLLRIVRRNRYRPCTFQPNASVFSRAESNWLRRAAPALCTSGPCSWKGGHDEQHYPGEA